MSATRTNDAPHTVLVHLNCEIPHTVWEDLMDGMYDQYVAAVTKTFPQTPMPREEWDWRLGDVAAVNALVAELSGAIAVGTDAENTPIMCETEICIPHAKEV